MENTKQFQYLKVQELKDTIHFLTSTIEETINSVEKGDMTQEMAFLILKEAIQDHRYTYR